MAESNASKLANNILTDGKFDATDVVGNITSTGIDDNATSTAITIDTNENVGIGVTVPSSQFTVGSGGTANPPSVAQIHSGTHDKYFLKLTSNGFNSASDWIGLGIGYSDDYLKSAIIGEAQDNYARTKLHFCTNSSTSSANASISDKRISIDYNGDISFYEDTGTTPKMFWDASDERLGIGTSSPSSTLDVNGSIRGDLELAPGKEYSMTSGAGTGTAIFDTSISLATVGILEVFYRGNSNFGGTASYNQTGLYYVQVGTGFNVSAVTTTITQTEVFKHVPFGSPGALTFSSVIFDGSSEVSSVTSTAGCQIRIKIAGYSASYTGSGTQVMIRRIF